MLTEVNHLYIKEITGDPEWNPVGLHVLSMSSQRQRYNGVSYYIIKLFDNCL